MMVLAEYSNSYSLFACHIMLAKSILTILLKLSNFSKPLCSSLTLAPQSPSFAFMYMHTLIYYHAQFYLKLYMSGLNFPISITYPLVAQYTLVITSLVCTTAHNLIMCGDFTRFNFILAFESLY